MKIILVVIMILLSSTTYAQDKKKIIELKNERVNLVLQDFYISDVIDGRLNQDNIGFAQVGIFNKKVNVDLNEGVEKSILDYLTNSYPNDTSTTPVTLKIIHLNISEKTGFSSEKGRAEIQIEFYKVTNGQLGKIYESEAFIEKAGMDVTNGHEKRIRGVLATCIEDFNNSNWKSISPDFKETQIVLADKTAISETQFSDKNRKKVRNHNLLTFNPYLGVNAKGWGLSYYGYSINDKSDWIIPWMISIESFTINAVNISKTDYREAKLGYSMPGISAFKMLGDNAYVNLSFLIPVGNEVLTDFNGDKKDNFLIGLATSQGIHFIPKSNFGITFGIGIYQRLLTSEVYKNDFGVRAEIGFKF